MVLLCINYIGIGHSFIRYNPGTYIINCDGSSNYFWNVDCDSDDDYDD